MKFRNLFALISAVLYIALFAFAIAACSAPASSAQVHSTAGHGDIIDTAEFSDREINMTDSVE